MPAEQTREFQTVTSDAVPRTLDFFSEDTPLKAAQEFGGRPYERRIQQEQMAYAIANALAGGRNLCVEAPTGVGKSFAYLVPAIYHAMSVHKPVLITTETINLQEQLVHKDLPFLRDLLGLNFSFVIAKGRNNYLCKRRLALARGEHKDEFLPLASLGSDVDRLADWSRDTRDGSRSEIPFRLDPQIWPCVCSEAANCAGPKCNYYSSCFYWRARHQWDKADLIVTNHALFFVDLKIRELEKQASTPLPAYCSVIFDEAHTIEDNAAKHMGLHLSSSAIRFLLNRLFNPSNARGLLMKPGEDSMAIRSIISRIHEATTDFFLQFSEAIEKSPEHCFRILKSGFYTDSLSAHLMELENILKNYMVDVEDEAFKIELSAQLERCTVYRESIAEFIEMAYEQHVYWVEGRNSQYSKQMLVELASAPLNVSELLRTILFASDIPVILTSATLAVRGTLNYFCQRVGFCQGDGMILDSPFDYEKQVKLYLSRRMPLPSESAYNDAASEQIKHFVELTQGRAFVLFTSYGMLKRCAENLSNYFMASGFHLLVHGESLSRSAMLREFKQNKSAVIFGATSFWTGVDVPGEALSNVIITKLPFAVPSHPLIQARCDRIKERGGEPFSEYSIPDAVLKFRQGIGRLIRSRTDRGIIVILDPRILSKAYGKIFLNSIPSCPVEYF